MTQAPEVLIVGGGPAGIAAAMRLARARVPVLLLEAADYVGAENWSGGVYHAEPLLREDVLGSSLWEQAPRERRITRRQLFVHDGLSGGGFEARAVDGNGYGEAWTVLRPRLDRWLAAQAMRLGVTILPRTAVTGLRIIGGCVTGVETARGPIEAPVVFLAEGDAAQLLQRSVNDRPAPRYAQGMMGVWALDAAAIDARFGLSPGEGLAQEWILADPCLRGQRSPLAATGFVYTNHESLSVGLVLPLDRLATHGGPDPGQHMQRFLRLPVMADLLGGARQIAYGVKVIRAGGQDDAASCSPCNGLAIGGAALNLGIDVPYPNFMGPAAFSGVAFADAVIELAGDYSKAALARAYGGRLQAAVDYDNAAALRAVPATLHQPFLFRVVPDAVGAVAADQRFAGRALAAACVHALRARPPFLRLFPGAAPTPVPPQAVRFLAVRATIDPWVPSGPSWGVIAQALGYLYGRGIPRVRERLAAIEALPLRRALVSASLQVALPLARGAGHWLGDAVCFLALGRRGLASPYFRYARRRRHVSGLMAGAPGAPAWLAPIARLLPDENHITAPRLLDPTAVARLRSVCPAMVYRPGAADGGAVAQYDNCIKCESCRLAVAGLDWMRTSGHRLAYMPADPAPWLDGSADSALWAPPAPHDERFQDIIAFLRSNPAPGPLTRAALRGAFADATLPPVWLRWLDADAQQPLLAALTAQQPQGPWRLWNDVAEDWSAAAERVFPQGRRRLLACGWRAEDRADFVALLHRRGASPAQWVAALAEIDSGLGFVAAHHCFAESRHGPLSRLSAVVLREEDGLSWWLPDTGGALLGVPAPMPFVAHGCGLDSARPVRMQAPVADAVGVDAAFARLYRALLAGIGRALYKRAHAFAHERVQFRGQFADREGHDAIVKFGAIKRHLAALGYALSAAARLENFCARDPAGVIAFLQQRMGVLPDGCAWVAGQIFGGIAYSEDDILARRYRDMMVLVRWPDAPGMPPVADAHLWTMAPAEAPERVFAAHFLRTPAPVSRPVVPRGRKPRARLTTALAYQSGSFLQGLLLTPPDVLVPEDFLSDPALRSARAAVIRLLRSGFRDPAGGPYGRYVDARHGLPPADIARLRAFNAFATIVPKELGGLGFSKAQYAILTGMLMGRADTAAGLLVMASTSIGSMPVMLGLTKDLPRLSADLAACDAATLAVLRRLGRRLERLANRPFPPAIKRTLVRMDEILQRIFLQRGSAIKYLAADLLRGFETLIQRARARDLAGLAAAASTFGQLLGAFGERAARERRELPERRLAHEQFLRFLATGQISAFALTEPVAGSDTGGIVTRARRVRVPLAKEGDGLYRFDLDGRVHVLLDQRRLEFRDRAAFYRLEDGRLARLDDSEWDLAAQSGRRCIVLPEGGTRAFDDIGWPQQDGQKLFYEFYAITGAKMWITNGSVADRYCLYAQTEDGETGFMVDRRQRGLRIGADEHKLGQRASPTNELTLTAVRACTSHVIGYQGHGQVNALETLSVGRGGLVSGCAHLLERMIADYGTLWAAHPQAHAVAVHEQERVATLAARLIGLMDRVDLTQGDFRIEAALSKFLASEGLHRVLAVLEDARGPQAAAVEELIEKWRRDARILNIYEGTNEIQRFLILKDLPAWLARAPGRGTGDDRLDAALATFRAFVAPHMPALKARMACGDTEILYFPVIDWLAELYVWCALSERRRACGGDQPGLRDLEADVAERVASHESHVRALFTDGALYEDAVRALACRSPLPAAAPVLAALTEPVTVLVRSRYGAGPEEGRFAGLDDADLGVLDEALCVADQAGMPVTAILITPAPRPDLAQRLIAAGATVSAFVAEGLLSPQALVPVLAQGPARVILAGTSDLPFLEALAGMLSGVMLVRPERLCATARGRLAGLERRPLAAARYLVASIAAAPSGRSDRFTVHSWLAALKTPVRITAAATMPSVVSGPMGGGDHPPKAFVSAAELAQWLKTQAVAHVAPPVITGQAAAPETPVTAVITSPQSAAQVAGLARSLGEARTVWLQVADAPLAAAAGPVVCRAQVRGFGYALCASLAPRLALSPLLVLGPDAAALGGALAQALGRPLYPQVLGLDGDLVCQQGGQAWRSPRPPAAVLVLAPGAFVAPYSEETVAVCEWGSLGGRAVPPVKTPARGALAEAEVVLDVGLGAAPDAAAMGALVEPLRAALAESLRLPVAVGATRRVVREAKLLAADCQIGQTGTLVAPRLLLAVGVSGAPQHLAGIAPATQVIAINQDPAAPIFGATTGGKAVIRCVGDGRIWMKELARALREGGP